MDLRMLKKSVNLDHPWYGVDKVRAFVGDAHQRPEAKDGPVVQPGSSVGLSLGFGEENYAEGGKRFYHVSEG